MEIEGANKIQPIELTKHKIKEITNFAQSISYIRTPHARTYVHNIAWNASLLHQNGDQRCEKPIVLNPRGVNLVRSGGEIILHSNDEGAYIVYTLDGTVPGYTNGNRYDRQRNPIFVPDDISFFSIKFVACKLKMRDSKI